MRQNYNFMKKIRFIEKDKKGSIGERKRETERG